LVSVLHRSPATSRTLVLEALEVLVERERAPRPLLWHAVPLVIFVHEVFHSGAIGPIVNVVAPMKAAGAEQSPRLQLVVPTLRADDRTRDLACGWVRPMRKFCTLS
jgi:hypothetical protein